MQQDSSAPGSRAAPPYRLGIFIAVGCGLLVLVLYVWLISVGTWTNWPGQWHSYDDLAASFRQGQLALQAVPEPSLLALADPFDPMARQGIPYPQDASLYHARFYLYFGPVPALLLVVAKSFISNPIGDQYLVFLFIAALFLVQAFVVVQIWRRLFTESPAWTLAPLILVLGLMNPWPWILSTPSVYSTAIAAGQFFLLCGLFVAAHALEQQILSAWQLALAGVFWVAALGSRITLIVPVAFLLALVALRFLLEYRRSGSRRALLRPAVSLLVVLGLGFLGLGWYNWARFGSVFETGLRYQLAGVELRFYGSRTFSPLYVPQNLFNYLLNPPRLKYAFPWLNPARGSFASVMPAIPLPSSYRTQEITGLLFAAPYLVLAILPAADFVRRHWPRLRKSSESQQADWLVAALAGSFLTGFAFFVFFFWVAERYFVDFLPGLVLLAILGAWQLDRLLLPRPHLRSLYWITLGVLMLLSTLAGLLLSISFNADSFRQLNPALWRQLSNLFRP